ncbi:serine/threonine protein kinase [Mucilaginibacter sp.]|uniref:serine/threonine protein kinase n=1 Tax=Mucilaginibacter sp. TaxID=1882438 RepID=UPI000CA6B362|nr:serine/threonine-protein kinase [Mucilaginibacter sp.]PLW91207.1 MAG: serine/threonine protein kinase [Mucilaginibacter sp.]HEK19576.1 serine/threonine protein kinase [Bacteroidota bacterium]
MSKVFTITEGLENLGALRTGGQGSVYKGRRMGPMITAVKILPTPVYAENTEDRNYRNFINEVGKLQKVNEVPNPNVVKILSSGITESGSLPYIEMEYIDGPDLCDLLQPPNDRVFTIKETIRLAYQLAGALAHCHKIGIKHGDVKSNNVKYYAQTGNYVLIDFGLAILTDEERRTSIRHAGAIEFMAPEQTDGQMLPQSDVYAYGIILYEMLTGSVPFPLTGNSETARNNVRMAHLESPVPDLRIMRQNNLPRTWTEEKREQEMQLPHWLLTIINKCLQKDPAQRYTSGVDLLDAVVEANFSGENKAGNAAVLAENERLRKLVEQFEKEDAEKNRQLASLQTLAKEIGAHFNGNKGVYESNRATVIMPKKTLGVIITLGLIFVAISLYAFFRSPASTGNVVYVPATNYLRPPYIPRQYNYDSVARAKHAALLAAKKRVWKSKKVLADSVTVAPPVKKKKRKKFLGIF